ncbi:glycosyltransferase family 57 protein [Stemphylium lycopersici]|nr:glycosyltransferase family 57 protein [Stemphylium lycopersici]
MAELYPSIAQCAIVATALKVLLFPAYKSTDFEVHRNWLALTHSLPVKEWYYEKTSEWTLDYPPFFAHFEWLLSQVAAYVDTGLLNVKDLGYDSWQTVYFQRTTVIVTELVLVYALHLYVKTSKSKVTAHAAALSVLLSPGLLIIDHIHFQYNGFLYGILILSMVLARNDSTLLLSGVGIIAVFAGAFGPFAKWGQLEQPILLRLLYKPTWEAFVGAVTLCGYASFLFGWHVHEKAILLVIIPFSLIALQDRRYFGAFRPLAVAGHVSLFPLLYTAAEFPVKTVYTIFWLVLFLIAFDRLAPATDFNDENESEHADIVMRVLFKRKPVKLEPRPKNLDENTEVWHIEQTGEVFVDYERYLERQDFYQQASGSLLRHSGGKMSNQIIAEFHAQESEVGSTSILIKADEEVTSVQTEASKEINSIFPDGLRSPVLHYVQFQDHHRMDDLVNDVFDHFKEHFMLHDRVSIEGDHSRRFGEITQITDNSRIHSMFGQSMDDNIRTYTYVITMEDNGEHVTKYKASELQRDKKTYSKLLLKAFLRNALKREEWIGAPWMVKDSLAKRYDIPTKIPDNKTRDAVLAAKKATHGIPNGVSQPVQPPYPPHLSNGHSPHVNGQRPSLPPGQGQPTFVNFSASGPPYAQHGPPPPFMAINTPPPQYLVNGPPIYNSGPPPIQTFPPPPHVLAHLQPHIAAQLMQMPPHGNGAPVNFPFQTSFPHNQAPRPSNLTQPQQAPPPSRPMEYVKYPCEDLEIKNPRLQVNRPPLKFFSDDVPDGVEPPAEEKKTGILMKSMGPLLCIWETLNVHDTVYMLDSFTFDDLVDAMRFTHETTECELFVEMHCAILKQIINDSGKIQSSLPNMDDDEDSSEDDSSESTPTPEPEPPVRTTRSSLRKSGAAQLVAKPRTPTPEPPKEVHKAADFVADFDWIERCKLRNFVEGGWQSIVVALLYRLSFDPARKEACDEILAELVPPEEESTPNTIAENYKELDVNLRISALEMILSLTIGTENFRDQLTAAAQEMTRLRKEKIEYQRKRKELADELCKLDIERKILLPSNTPASPTDTKMTEDVDVSMTSINEDSKDASVADANDDDDVAASKTRTRPSNKNKRKAAAEEARKEKAKKAKAEAEKNKKQKEWEKLLTAIEKKKDELKDCEANINELDDDLRETLVHRSKILGKDRFLNKYYWFEHNGMPFGGVPNSSTAEYGYANGRIWVQGPSEYELGPNLEEPALSQDMQRFGYTVPQRKEREEGSTHLSKSTEWAYYDDPEDIDKLLAWLDERGLRERVLRKELQAFRDRIAEYMLKMRKHLEESDKAEEEEEEDNKTRVSTRNKANVDKDAPKDRCLRWTNSIMREEFGHNHFDEYEPPKKGKAKPVKATKGKGRGR